MEGNSQKLWSNNSRLTLLTEGSDGSEHALWSQQCLETVGEQKRNNDHSVRQASRKQIRL